MLAASFFMYSLTALRKIQIDRKRITFEMINKEYT